MCVLRTLYAEYEYDALSLCTAFTRLSVWTANAICDAKFGANVTVWKEIVLGKASLLVPLHVQSVYE